MKYLIIISFILAIIVAISGRPNEGSTEESTGRVKQNSTSASSSPAPASASEDDASHGFAAMLGGHGGMKDLMKKMELLTVYLQDMNKNTLFNDIPKMDVNGTAARIIEALPSPVSMDLPMAPIAI
ncbi:uncharacterized protein LOC141850077 [Brevipalpus obovatus]|uniref:uncharacterized protein LOC141850077 n=1 Tax=Brevipalpus obovatus TaxID=246614 RepID=UPI003D9ECF66